MENRSEGMVLYYPAPESPLAPDELAQVIGASLDGSPKLLQAFRQVLGDALASATVECADAKLSEREAGHAGGRVAAVSVLQHKLASYVRAVRELRAGKPAKKRG